MDDIIFGTINETLCKELTNLKKKDLVMNMMGEVIFFLGLQLKQTNDGIFISYQYARLLHKFGMDTAKPCPTPMSSSTRIAKDGIDFTKPSFPTTKTSATPSFYLQYRPKKYVTPLALMDDPDSHHLTSENHHFFQDLQPRTEVVLRTSPGLRRRYIREHSV